jgi:CheY-like chemotaxis protein
MNVPITIVLADDDPTDCLLVQSELARSRLANVLFIVHDGEALLDYLHRRGAYTTPGTAPRPGLILLDLNMPKVDGREALEHIKRDPTLRRIPVVVLTASRAEADMYRSSILGANAFITKPVTFERLVTAVRGLGSYWFEIVQAPEQAGSES